MPIFSNLTQPNIKDISTLSADGFPFTPLARQEEERAKRTTDISGRRFAELLRRPKWIVLENVAGLFTILELESLSKMEIQEVEFFCADEQQKTNKTIINLQRRVIGTIISEIQSAGYILPKLEDGTPIILCIPACAVDTHHRRDREWFIARSQYCTDFKIADKLSDIGSNRKYNKIWSVPTAFNNRWSNHHASRGGTDPFDKGYKRRQNHLLNKDSPNPIEHQYPLIIQKITQLLPRSTTSKLKKEFQETLSSKLLIGMIGQLHPQFTEEMMGFRQIGRH